MFQKLLFLEQEMSSLISVFQSISEVLVQVSDVFLFSMVALLLLLEWRDLRIGFNFAMSAIFGEFKLFKYCFLFVLKL